MHSLGRDLQECSADASPQAKSQPAGIQWKQQNTNIRIAAEDKLLRGCPLYYLHVEHVLSGFYM